MGRLTCSRSHSASDRTVRRYVRICILLTVCTWRIDWDEPRRREALTGWTAHGQERRRDLKGDHWQRTRAQLGGHDGHPGGTERVARGNQSVVRVSRVCRRRVPVLVLATCARDRAATSVREQCVRCVCACLHIPTLLSSDDAVPAGQWWQVQARARETYMFTAWSKTGASVAAQRPLPSLPTPDLTA
ncbi:hypothetical protein K466DRAFT_93761 [Polyporus arcularius HHB13444]|uniref:Uncharacterized protein n=1 Tax=Polyporus arcularius HHB13444 TaxID=1314778 RepID=A0A5C3NM23_9APHY|nr:hypothetical protein K466DRAFT_93761 [Polyporus arcularius HHB13444]